MTELSKEYASALFELAMEDHSEAEFAEALQTILSLMAEEPEYYDLLASPNIPYTERQHLLEQAFGFFPEPILAWLVLLCKKGHIRMLPDCIRKYEALYQASQNTSEATVISAVPLTDSEKKTLLRKLEQRSSHSVHATYQVDPQLIGGLIVQMDDWMLDGSLRHKLKEVKEVMGE
jgi:F-type H+-transporting ATPase subunit delta